MCSSEMLAMTDKFDSGTYSMDTTLATLSKLKQTKDSA